MGSIKHAISARWKTLTSNYSDIDENNLYQNHYVIKGARVFSTIILSSKEIHSILISNIFNKRNSNIHSEILFDNITLDWSKMYLLTRLAAIDPTQRSFQYKILNNVFFLNKEL